MLQLYIYNKIRGEIFDDELYIRKADIKYFYKETCTSEVKYWVVPSGEAPIRITKNSYEYLKVVLNKE